MSQIDDLIAEHCPEGVRRVTLGSVSEYFRGLTYKKTDEAVDGGIRVLRSNNISITKNSLDLTDVKTVSSDVRVRLAQMLRKGDILISAASGSKAHVGKVAYIWEDMDFAFGGFMAAIRTGDELSSRFLFHLLIGKNFDDYLSISIDSSTINNLNASIMNRFEIPLPPLKVQREIVRILDNFTQLEAELDAELDARRNQFDILRDQLLLSASEGQVRWQPMGEIADLNWGDTSTTKAAYVDSKSGFLAFSASGPDGTLPHFDFDRTAVVLSAIGALAGKTWLAKGKWSCIKNTIRFFSRDEATVSTEFLYWVTSTKNYWPRRGAAQPFIAKGDADKLLVPIPPLEEQQRIVDILDKFDALVNDISTGLPAELAARRKQYEYYRNRLLTFPEKVA